MASVEQWRPFRELERVREQFERLMDRFGEDLSDSDKIRPRLECFFDDGKLTIRAELPGIDPKDIEVDVTANTLTIKARREETTEHTGRRFLRREMRYGIFERAMQLPAAVRAEDIRATYRDGILELSTPVPKELQRSEVRVHIRHEEPKSELKVHETA